MSATRETANADMDQVIPRLVGDIASGRAEEVIFFTKMLHRVQHFCEKREKVPCCRRRIRIPSGETSSLLTHRVNPVNNMRYAVGSKSGVHLDERPDSPPAGRKIPYLYHKKFTLCVNFL
jgi:hypothetical protein